MVAVDVMVLVTTSGVRLSVGVTGVTVVSTVVVIDTVAVGVTRVFGARERAINPTQ
jgi:hypothetical protein